MSWIYSNDNPYYPKDSHPKLWAWNLETGKVVWGKDFSDYGRGGNDCGICLLDGKLYYSTFFGYAASKRKRRGLPLKNEGLTACLEPETGKVVWLTNKYYVTSKCTLSARDGRIYVGGYNRAKEGTNDRFVWCLDAKDGSLVWQSEPVTSALNVVSVGKTFVFSNALRGKGNVFNRTSGKVVSSIGHNYACLPLHAFRALRSWREYGHDRPVEQRQTGSRRAPQSILASVWEPSSRMAESSIHPRRAASSSHKPSDRHHRTCPQSGRDRDAEPALVCLSVFQTSFLRLRFFIFQRSLALVCRPENSNVELNRLRRGVAGRVVVVDHSDWLASLRE